MSTYETVRVRMAFPVAPATSHAIVLQPLAATTASELTFVLMT